MRKYLPLLALLGFLSCISWMRAAVLHPGVEDTGLRGMSQAPADVVEATQATDKPVPVKQVRAPESNTLAVWKDPGTGKIVSLSLQPAETEKLRSLVQAGMSTEEALTSFIKANPQE